MLELKRTCPEEWVDFNGHMRDAYYALLVSFANDQTMDELGLGPRYLKATGCTLYNIDMRVQYLKEAHGGDPLVVEMRLLDADAKRLHLHSIIRHEETRAPLAVLESVLMHIDRADGPASAPFPPEVKTLVDARLARDAGPEPEFRTGGVGLRR